MKPNYNSTIVGLILLLLYFIQFVLELDWNWLSTLQSGEMYKRWSGLVLALFITLQWILTLSRVIKRYRKYSQNVTVMHKWLGAVSPLLFYIHSMGVGYGYLALLAYLFFANTLLGCINLDVIRNNSELLFKGWMISHVAFSIVITVLMFFHIGIVFYYK